MTNSSLIDSNFGNDLEANLNEMAASDNYYQWIYSELAPYLTGNIVEIGAGTGNFTSLILNSPISKLFSFEPSRNMFDFITNRFETSHKLSLLQKRLEEESDTLQGSIDAVIYINVLEHIEDDLKELRLANSVLRPGGHLLVFVPAVPFLYSKFDAQVGHYRRYDKSSLKKLVSEVKFELISLKYLDIIGIIPWFILFTLMKKIMLSNKVELYDKFIIPFARKVEGILPPPIGKNLIMVARKPVTTDK